MSTRKLSPGEELEKQYNDYKAQFEEWKERNKESVGTEAYVRYVKQFEDWERDVQKQRAMVRQKAEEETRRKADAEKMARRRQEEAEAASQRAAEQNRIANRQRRLVAAAAASTAAAATAERQPQETPQQPTPLHRKSSAGSPQRVVQQSTPIQQSGGTTEDVSGEINPMVNIVQQFSLNFTEKQNGAEIGREFQSAHHQHSQNQQIMESHYYQHHEYSVHLSQPAQLTAQPSTRQPIVENESNIVVTPTVSAPATVILQQQPPPVETQSPPQLWGGEGASYAVTDPMFRRWNVRAAPPNFCVSYEPPPPNVTTNPYWMLVEKMREKKLVLAPSLKATIAVPTPGAPVLNGAPSVEWSSPNKPPSLMSGPVAPPPAVGVPPPFRPSHAPPPFHPSPHFATPHPAARPPPHMYNIPPPNFRLPPPTATAGGPPPYYNAK